MPRFHLTSTLRRGAFRRGISGNVSIIFALSLVPLVGLVGLGVDYGVALSVKAKLDNAADVAAIAAVATAKAYVAANPNDANLDADARAAGQAQAARAFTVNAGSLPFAAVPTPSITMPPRSGQTYTATVAYQTQSINNFGRLFAQPNSTISGNTVATADIPSYLDFYLLIDVSASMGLPSTSGGQDALAKSTTDNCQFACHFPDQRANYNYAIRNNIQLRSGAVNTAVCNLLTLAAQPLVPNQYRVGLYPFITRMATLSPITATISNSQIAATCYNNPSTEFTTLLDIGSTQLMVNNDPTTGTGSGGTHFETTLASIQTTISPYGDGSSAAKSRPFVFLITDGMENAQYFAGQKNGNFYQPYTYPGGRSSGWPPPSSGAWWTGTSPQAIDPTLCSTLKQKGVTVSILYIPYTIGQYVNADTGETTLAQNVISATPGLQAQLQSCASTGYFQTANTAADINTALQIMFAQAVQAAHLVR